ncbi:MAG: 2OG-Fe(II) oxygenase, partial [Bacteroidia bacterium]
MEDFLPASILTLVDDFFAVQLAEGALAPAKIGTAFEEQRQAEIRSDFICWIDQGQHPQLNPFFQLIEELKGLVAQELFLSLEGFEFHLAQYPPGGFYKPHLDQFKARNNRMLSLVNYLNRHWI